MGDCGNVGPAHRELNPETLGIAAALVGFLVSLGPHPVVQVSRHHRHAELVKKREKSRRVGSSAVSDEDPSPRKDQTGVGNAIGQAHPPIVTREQDWVHCQVMRLELTPLVERLRSLAKRGDVATIREELEDIHEVDLADALERMTVEEGLEVFRKLEPVDAAFILTELTQETQRLYSEELSDEVLAYYLDILPMDDALGLRESIGEDRFEVLLNMIPQPDAQEIRRSLRYPEDSVGRVMTEGFFKVNPDQSIASVLADIRLASEDKYESVYDLYVLDEGEHLLGVFSLRRAVRARPDLTARELMNDEIVTARASDPAETVARDLARYGFRALPVVDDRGRMVGVLTGDDAQYLIGQADTVDVLKLGAVGGDADSYLSLNPLQLYRRRVVWLLGLFVAETLTGTVMRHYAQAAELNPLTFFIPLIIGAGGNTGSQATTTITRAIAVGDVKTSDLMAVLKRELPTSVMLGLTLGAIGYFRAIFWTESASLIPYVVGLSLPLVTIWATCIGGILPILAKRLRFDPAVMSAPFISTFVDATGLIIYFEVALRILGRNAFG